MNSMILVVLVSAGAIISLGMAVNEIPAIWSFVPPWLGKLILINGIIIAIAAASRFRWSQPAPPILSQETPLPAYYAAYSSPPEVREVAEVPEAAEVYEREDKVVELKPVMVNGLEVGADAEEEVVAGDEGKDALEGSTLTYNTPSPERFPMEFQLEYFPPADLVGNFSERVEEVSRTTHEEVRHGEAGRPAPDRHTRKSKSFKEPSVHNDSPPSQAPSRSNRRVDASMDRSLTCNSLSRQNPIGNIPTRGGETEEEYETLESAWKKITKGAIGKDSASSSGLGKEVSPSTDELNQRAEAFIKKVNYEIRSRRSNQYIQLNSAA